MTNNETVWTDWIKNPGTGECPVPEWAEGLRIAFGDGSDGEYGIPATSWHWGCDLGPSGRITHYRYSIPADLSWLAENVGVWRHRMKLVRKSGARVEFFQPEYFPGRKGYTHAQWLRTRQDLGLTDTHPVTEEEEEAWRERVEAQEAERMKHIVLNGNDGDHYAEVSDGSRNAFEAHHDKAHAMAREALHNQVKERLGLNEASDGSTASYYELPEGATELQHLISHRNLNAQDGEIFRAIYRKGLCPHSSLLREAKKVLFYAQAEVERLEGKERG